MNDETRHYFALSNRLKDIGSSYTTLPVNTGLRELVKSSSTDLQTRLVVISLFQEGRGLDAGTKLLEKLKSQREKEGMEILKIILEEEVGHVSIGMKWFKFLCEIKSEHHFFIHYAATIILKRLI